MRSKSTTASLLSLLFLAASVFGPMSSYTTAAQKTAAPAKGKQVEKTHAEKGRGGGPDQNIKNDSEANDPNKPAPAPGNKGGEKARGAGACQVVLDNRTGWYVHIFVDGTNRGTIGPWGDAYCYTGSGATVLYAIATFTDGSRFTWGPRTVNCYDSFTWQLFP